MIIWKSVYFLYAFINLSYLSVVHLSKWSFLYNSFESLSTVYMVFIVVSNPTKSYSGLL